MELKNAGILAAQILGVAHKEVQEEISKYKKSLEEAVLMINIQWLMFNEFWFLFSVIYYPTKCGI